MSIWYEIEDKQDVDTSDDFTEVHILFKSDDMGNHYVSVPVEILLDLLIGVEGAKSAVEPVASQPGSDGSGGPKNLGVDFCYTIGCLEEKLNYFKSEAKRYWLAHDLRNESIHYYEAAQEKVGQLEKAIALLRAG